MFGMVWYGMVGPDQSLAIIMVGPLGRVGQRLLLRVVLLAPNQIIVRLNLGPRIALGEVWLSFENKGHNNFGRVRQDAKWGGLIIARGGKNSKLDGNKNIPQPRFVFPTSSQ